MITENQINDIYSKTGSLIKEFQVLLTGIVEVAQEQKSLEAQRGALKTREATAFKRETAVKEKEKELKMIEDRITTQLQKAIILDEAHGRKVAALDTDKQKLAEEKASLEKRESKIKDTTKAENALAVKQQTLNDAQTLLDREKAINREMKLRLDRREKSITDREARYQAMLDEG